MDWTSILTPFDHHVLDFLGTDYRWGLPTDKNPIIEALRAPITRSEGGDQMSFTMTSETKSFAAWVQDFPGNGKAAMARLATICQMAVQDANGGPDGDDKRKAQRRQWYAWYKTRFAQPYATQLAELGDEHELKGFDGVGWNGRQSQVFGCLVDDDRATYWDLWVEDNSRMMETFHQTLFSGLNIVLAVEKDSLLADFTDAAKRIGARLAVSGKGKMSKGATEKYLRDTFGWQPDYDPFTEDSPLYVLTVTDLDKDGEAVIAETFASQVTRYSPHVIHARVGITYQQVVDHIDGHLMLPEVLAEEVRQFVYEGKTNDQGYISWSDEKAIFFFECISESCDEHWVDQGSKSRCPRCGLETGLRIKVDKQIVNQPYTLEVEALPTQSYYNQIVKTLLQVVPFETIVSKLRDECTASSYNAAGRIREEILNENPYYQRLQEQLVEIQEALDRFSGNVQEFFQDKGEPHISDWREEEDDPEPPDFVRHVVSKYAWGPWRPFDPSIRTGLLVDWLEEEYGDQIQDLKDQVIE